MSQDKVVQIREILQMFDENELNKKVVVHGWVKTKRGNKNVSFIELNDGSTIKNIQVVIEPTKISEDILKIINTGACLRVIGELSKSPGENQQIEVHAEEIYIYGQSDPDQYPLQKKSHSLEFLREIAHLRARTNTFGAIFRLRHNMAFAVHKYLNEHGFFYVNTPILTASDCEGAGEMFQVTTLGLDNVLRNEAGQVDYSKDFFGKSTNLTVSGQLEAETIALALSRVYTFGPTFRAENSNTSRHLAEFWMIEPEVAFNNINDNMDLAEDFIKYLINYALTNCADDLQFLNDKYDLTLLGRLRDIISTNFERVKYVDAYDILVKSGVKFEYELSWGCDFQSEHERFLAEKYFMKPVILTDFPKDKKAFYMKLNGDGQTVRAMDVIFPKIGEIIGGSEREENFDKLSKRIDELNLSTKDLWWYLETRKFGTAPHSGFGIGFERLILLISGMANIRDVIPFPRTPGNAEF